MADTDYDNAQETPDGIPYRECKERILTQLITAAKKEREAFLKQGDRINVFASGGEDKIAAHLLDMVPHAPKLNKASQFVDVIGSSLYEQNPTRRVEPRKYAPEGALMRSVRMEEYLNYIPRETNLKYHFRRMIVEGCIYGKGVIWTGWDKDKNIVTSTFGTVKELLVDPDARNKEEPNWKARERKKPRWWLKKNIPEAKELIDTLAPSSKKARSSKGNDYTTETICFHEVYMKIGLHNYDGGAELLEKQDGSDEAIGDDTPKIYIISSDGKLLQEKEWDVPLYKKQLWPCAELDFKENNDGYWPVSPMWPGISQLENMNWLYRHMMARVRQAARGFLVLMDAGGVTVDSDDIDRLLDIQATPDGVWDLIRLKAGAMGEGLNINQVIQEFKLEARTDEFLKAIAFEEEEFAKATGLYGILFQGQTETQMRSAKEVQFREKTSRSRIEDMQKSVETCSDELATVQAAYAKFLSTEEDIIPILGEQGAQEWGFLVPSLEDETARFTLEMVSQGAPPEEAIMMGQQLAQQQDEALRQQGGTTFDEWVKESVYSVQGGSTRRKDVDEEKEVYSEAANQLEPALFKSGNPALMLVALRIAYQRFELFGASQQLLNDISGAMQIIAETPPPLPPPPPGGGGPQPGASPPAPPPEG